MTVAIIISKKFGISVGQLKRLGVSEVRVDIVIPPAPYIYPTKKQLVKLLKLAPLERREMVRAWREEKFEMLLREYDFSSFKAYKVSGARCGLNGIVKAKELGKLQSLRHAEMIIIKSIEGFKKRAVLPPERKWYTVRVRFAEQTEGLVKGTILYEDPWVLLKANSEKQAREKSQRGL